MFYKGKEHQTTLGEQSSSQLASNNFHGSSTMSMHSDSSDATMNSSSVQHNPDVLEDIKQQKDILEQGIFRLVFVIFEYHFKFVFNTIKSLIK